MSRDISPLGLRMPPEIKERIEAAAKANGRSMNAEILARLQATFEEADDQSALRNLLKEEIQKALNQLKRGQRKTNDG